MNKKNPFISKAGCVVMIGFMTGTLLFIGRFFIPEIRDLPATTIIAIGAGIMFIGALMKPRR